MGEDREASEDALDRDADPYDELDADGEVDDPFAELEAGNDDVSEPDQTSGEGGEIGKPGETGEPGETGKPANAGKGRDDSAETAGTDPGPSNGHDDVEDPFDELGEVDEDLAEDAFERMEVEDLGEEDVWEALAAGETAHETAGATPVDDTTTDHVVDKREYCQRCPHFSSPPKTACTHEEGTIVEVLAGDEFRVRGCPMVGKEGPAFDRGK